MQRYFLEEAYTPKELYQVSGEPYHHMVRVMRMTPEARVYLAFNDQLSIVAEITEISETTVFLKEIEKEQQEKEYRDKVAKDQEELENLKTAGTSDTSESDLSSSGLNEVNADFSKTILESEEEKKRRHRERRKSKPERQIR